MISLLLDAIIQNTTQGWMVVIGATSIPITIIGSVVWVFVKKIIANRTTVQNRDHKDVVACCELSNLLIQIHGANDEKTIRDIKEQASEIMRGVEKRNFAYPELAIQNKKTSVIAEDAEKRHTDAIKAIASVFDGVKNNE